MGIRQTTMVHISAGHRRTRASAGAGAGAGAAAVSHNVGGPVLQFEHGRRVYWYVSRNSRVCSTTFGHMDSVQLASGLSAQNQGIFGTIACKPEIGKQRKRFDFGPGVSNLFLAPDEDDEVGGMISDDDACSDNLEEGTISAFSADEETPSSQKRSLDRGLVPDGTSAIAAPSPPALADGTLSPERKKNKGRWTKDENALFKEAVGLYGKDWPKVAQHVKTRDVSQCRDYARDGGFGDLLQMGV